MDKIILIDKVESLINKAKSVFNTINSHFGIGFSFGYIGGNGSLTPIESIKDWEKLPLPVSLNDMLKEYYNKISSLKNSDEYDCQLIIHPISATDLIVHIEFITNSKDIWKKEYKLNDDELKDLIRVLLEHKITPYDVDCRIL